MGGVTFTEINYDAQWVDNSLASIQNFSWLFSWGMYIFLLVALAVMFWVFFDSVTKRKDQQALVPRLLSMVGFFAIIPAFIFRFTGNADGVTCLVKLNAENPVAYYPGPINWNVNWLVSGYGTIVAMVALLGMVLSIVAIVIYASTVHRSKPSTEFVQAFNGRMAELENKMSEQQHNAQMTGAGSSLSGAVSSTTQRPSSRRPAPAATIIDRKPQAATIIDVPQSGATLTVQTGTGRGRTYNLPVHDVVVGRDPACFVVVDDGKVSREHVRLLFGNGRWSALDMGSVNGTLLNGSRLVGQQPISNGDQLTIGDTVLVFGSAQ